MHIFNKAACGLPLLLSLMSTNGWATTLAEALSAAENYPPSSPPTIIRLTL
jgi:hypothetical protein